MEICYCGHPKERHSRKCKEKRNRLETNYYVSACYHCVCKEYAHNELLETHTVKEERVECHCGNGVDCPEECCALCECATYEDGVHTKSTCNTPIDCPCHKEEVKEEKTTPDKKCCDDCKKYELGVNCQCVCHGVLPRHQGEKLTTSSYEVTRGRCEKSIKHSCGRV